jgi:molecular chaperone DnaK
MHTLNLFETLRSRSVAGASRRVLGIDLGTTNSTVAAVNLPVPPGANPETACNDLSIEQKTLSGPTYSTLVPSIIALDSAGQEWIGEGAKRLRAEAFANGLSPERNLFSDTKNDMGISKTYHRAGEDYDHAKKIAAKVLRFLGTNARQVGGAPVVRTTVTVPASFQVSQRADTLWAADAAGLGIADEDLLDEPVAALTDYLFTYAEADLFPTAKTVLVFDFGGGTCDVFLSRIEPRPAGAGLNVTALSVSRYHRLGGYDFDAAIIHEHLIPALMKEHGLAARHFSWAERKKIIEPSLRSCAEALKEGLCREIKQLQEFGRYADSDKPQIIARMVSTPVRVGKQEYILTNPTLNAHEWEALLEPFLNADMLHCRETDYRQEMSIFTPVTDALQRAKVKPEELDYVLLAGGSSLIPQVQAALATYFKAAKLLRFPDSTAAQSAIARGAAWSAAWLEVTSEPFVQPTVGDGLALRVQGRAPLVLIPAGTPIPFPPDGTWKNQAGLTLPRDFTGKLKVELVSMPDEQVVLH